MKQTERLGVNAVERIFIKELGWIFREQTIADWGIDAQAEVANDSRPTGRLLALQIKSGKSFFQKKGNVVFHGKRRHLEYWISHSLPVVIVIHNPETNETLWQRVSFEDVEYQNHENWSLEIPRENILDAGAREQLEHGVSDISAQRRIRLTLDAPLIREIADKRDVYLQIEQWPNKSLSFRGARIFYDDLEKDKPDHEFDIFIPVHDIKVYMEMIWPWLSCEYVNEPDLSGFEEVTTHDFNVVLNDIGKAFLLLEEFYENGRDGSDVPDPFERTVEDFDYPSDEDDPPGGEARSDELD
ncbi:MAG: DUF4365 domain-containing protein [Bradyrhizobium sp.]|uniref:DUF4365 domain-containing protein n=1 Tax=Bradyrhizobium sp. TaxID=376 RepID=UPI0029A65141|nr:DUF4365 domain-containing protein [Bradyrhizobium sp.]MDX3971606.1 DUF4365 domain-containing protein [Bradyrhizobium sp.]